MPMFQLLFAHFVTELENAVTAAQNAVSNSCDAYALAGVALVVTGVVEAQVYQAVPQMNPRTVRRVLAGRTDSVRMCMCSEVQTEQVHKDSTEKADWDSIPELAGQAKVRLEIATAAVSKYQNAPSRVARVLRDIHSLREAGCRVWNPTGLFTRLMRSGEDVRLPERVVQARAAVADRQAQAAAKPQPQIGMLTRFCGEVCRIIGLTTQFAEVENNEGHVMNVSRDSLRLIV